VREKVADAIKSSSLSFGNEPAFYETTAQRGAKMSENEIDYAGDYARAKALKKALTTSNMSFDTDEAKGMDL